MAEQSNSLPPDSKEFDARQADIPASDSAAKWLQQWESNNSEVAQWIFDEYSNQLRRVAESKLGDSLRKRFDGEDVVQSAFRSFFRRHSLGEFHIESRGQLWQLLVKITLCKSRSFARLHTAAKRDARNDQALKSRANLIQQIVDHEELLSLKEEVETVLLDLPDESGEILALILQGETKVEAARIMGITRQTVHRTLKVIQNRLMDQLDAARSRAN